MRLILGVSILCCSIPAVCDAQKARPEFEVASVKPTPADRQNNLRMDFCQAGGRFAVGGTPVLWSIRYAFRMKDYQIANAPPWLDQFDSAYDIEGKPGAPVSNEECRLMVQSLFAERFKLAVHREVRESTVYLLTVGNKGAKLRAGGGVRLNGSVQVEESGKPQWADGWTTPELAVYLSDVVGRPVVDRTGLEGRYGVELRFSRKEGDEAPSIFTAVQEQLGLRLVSGKAPVEMLIIDHIERPSAN